MKLDFSDLFQDELESDSDSKDYKDNGTHDNKSKNDSDQAIGNQSELDQFLSDELNVTLFAYSLINQIYINELKKNTN